MTMRSQTLVGVFNESQQAENAIEQLHNAGIPDDQISYSGDRTGTASNGFLAAIKSLFTGEDTNAHTLFNDLTTMGLSQDEAQYYTNQHQAGRAIVAVNPGDREQYIQTILDGNGAYSYRTQQTGLGSNVQQPNAGYVQTPTPDYTQTQNTPQSADYAQNPSPTYAQAGSTNYTTPNRSAEYTQSGNYAQPDNANYDMSNRSAEYTQSRSSNYNNPNAQSDNYSQPDTMNYDTTNRSASYTQPSNSAYDLNAQADPYAQPSTPNGYRQHDNYTQPSAADPTRTNYRQPDNYAQPGNADPTNPTYNSGQGAYVTPNENRPNTGNQTSEEQQRLADWERREKARIEREREAQARQSDPNQNNW